MADDELLHAVGDSPHEHATAVPLKLDEVDGEQLIADTDALLQSLIRSKQTTKTESENKRDMARMKAGQRRDAYRARLLVERATLRQQDADLT